MRELLKLRENGYFLKQVFLTLPLVPRNLPATKMRELQRVGPWNETVEDREKERRRPTYFLIPTC